ncbi:MAG TPA: hypothetical protein VKE24_09775 [Candidatus Acidoferrales bacterium]|nr:hypothetical protein [Candidatus Acidoferrales bacterium]
MKARPLLPISMVIVCGAAALVPLRASLVGVAWAQTQKRSQVAPPAAQSQPGMAAQPAGVGPYFALVIGITDY